jgi:hypothetical protein
MLLCPRCGSQACVKIIGKDQAVIAGWRFELKFSNFTRFFIKLTVHDGWRVAP